MYLAGWVGAAMGKDAASTASKGVAAANPARCLSLSFLDINHQRTMRSQYYAKEFCCEFLSNSAELGVRITGVLRMRNFVKDNREKS